jgi:hypothetical protein
MFILAINGAEQPAIIQTPLRRAHHEWQLTGPALDAKQGVGLNAQRMRSFEKGILHVPAHSALLIEPQGE